MISSNLYSIERILRKVSDPLSYVLLRVATVLLAVMMFLVAAGVFMRYVVNSPILGDMELIRFMLITMISFSLAYCASKKNHVRVTAIVGLLPQYLQSVINVLVNIITLGFLVMLVRYSAIQGMVLLHRGYSTIMYKIPLFPFSVVLSFGFLIFAFVVFVDLISSLAEVFDV